MPPRHLAPSLAIALLLTGCASKPAPAIPTAPRPVPAPTERSFADVVKGATEHPGFFTLWRRQERVWLEITPQQLGRPFLLMVDHTHGIGQQGRELNGNHVGPAKVAVLRRRGGQIQLLVLNTPYTAAPGTPAARAVRESFSDSLLSAAPVLGTPHPKKGSVLVDAAALLVHDLTGGAHALEAAFRVAYAFDASASHLGSARAQPDDVGFDVTAHFKLGRLPVASFGSTQPAAPVPGGLADPRSLFLGYHYRFVRLPAPYRTRPADDRVGNFALSRQDFTTDARSETDVHHVWRWRLEKTDPAAATSRPRRPIVYWLDANVPERYRGAIKAGILEWNKAFEKAGFQDAIVVRDAPPGAAPDRMPLPSAWVRWFIRLEDSSLAVGSSQTDPRTGEILHAHISISDNWPRGAAGDFQRELPRRTPAASQAHAGDERADGEASCGYAAAAGDEMGFALDLLEARGELAPDSPEAEAFVQARIKMLAMHEAGHTLGLRHNFRASTAYAMKQLDDPTFTRESGLSASVMDYNAANIALPGQPQGEYFMSTIGPYDYWAIEYAYRPIPPAEEAAELARIAGRSAEPGLTLSTDQDAGSDDEFAIFGIDPEVNRQDLGADPLAFARRRLVLSRELWDRLAERQLPPGTTHAELRYAFEGAFNHVARAARVAAKYIGGVTQVRDHAGGARPPFTPVPAERQREALDLLRGRLFAAEAFRFSPALLNRLGVDRLVFHRSDATFRLHDSVVNVQRSLLNHLLSPAVAARIVDMETRYQKPQAAFRISELYDGLLATVWSELRARADIPPLRRSLQSVHLDLLVRLALRPAPGTPSDARSLARANLRQLDGELERRLRAPMLPETRAHLEDCRARVAEARRAAVALPPS